MCAGVRSDPGSDEARLARRVSAYDDALAGGTTSNRPDEAHSTHDHDAFLKARECIDLLNLVWPRGAETREEGPGPETLRLLNHTVGCDLLPAIEIPGFKIVGLLGRGGMGIVYRAEQASLKREVALKFLPAHLMNDPKRLERFHKEALVAASVSGAGILPVYDVLQIGGVPVIVMQFVDGVDLGRIIKGRIATKQGTPDLIGERHPWSELSEEEYEEKILNALDMLVAAVAALHDANIVHRDIKPSNVLVDRKGNVWLSDFGLARLGDESDLTHEGTQLGSCGFMSPEQWDGHIHLDCRVDVFGLGATIYDAITLKLPYGSGSLNFRTPLAKAPLWASGKKLGNLDSVILKALEPDRKYRQSSCQEFAGEWVACRNGEDLPETRPLRLLRRISRRVVRRSWSVSDLMVVVVFVGLLILAYRGMRSAPHPTPPPSASVSTRDVLVKTRPAGARVVLVPLDPATGSLQPDKRIRSSRGKTTPVIISNVPTGDYFVEVELKGLGFHQVFRRVPSSADQLTKWELGEGKFLKPPHRSWIVNKSGTIELPVIDIVPPPSSVEMAELKGNSKFVMGDPAQGLPEHVVSVEPFAIDTGEVTNGEFKAVFEVLPAHARGPSVPQGDRFPVVYVNQEEAMMYAERVGKRLPWEQEFEYAATEDGKILPPLAAQKKDERPKTKDWSFGEVRRPDDPDRRWHDPEVFGLFSNVAEWTNNWYVNYPGAPAITSIARPAETRIVRGGPPEMIDRNAIGVLYPMMDARFRYGFIQGARHAGLGFRCVRSLRPWYLD